MLEQIFRSGVGLNGVEHDSDTFRQLIKERVVSCAEAIERGEFHHALDLPFEHDREHQDIHGAGLAETGTDGHVIFGRIGDENLLLLHGALPDQTFAELEGGASAFAIAVGVAGQQLEVGLAFLLGAVDGVEDALLGGDDRRQFGEDELADREEILLALKHA